MVYKLWISRVVMGTATRLKTKSRAHYLRIINEQNPFRQQGDGAAMNNEIFIFIGFLLLSEINDSFT